jgi:hypothetical protein
MLVGTQRKSRFIGDAGHIQDQASSFFYSNLENMALRARSELNGFAGKDSEQFWSTGVLEYWSVGKS